METEKVSLTFPCDKTRRSLRLSGSQRGGKIHDYAPPDGFSKPQSGTVNILGLECLSNQKEIQGRLGYLPGEIAFQEDMTGIAYLKLIAKMRHMKDFSYGEKLIDFLSWTPAAASSACLRA